MAWLKGLAGKAEDFLNQIDQNAAVALQKDRNQSRSTDSVLTEVKCEEQLTSTKETVDVPHPRFRSSPWVSSSPMKPSSSVVKQRRKSRNDEELIDFLNGSQPLTAVGATEEVVQMSEVSERYTPIVSHQGSLYTDQPRIVTPVPGEDLRTENSMLKNELRTLNNEVSQLLQRCKSIEKENRSLQKSVSSLQESHVLHSQTLKEKESEISLLQRELKQARQQAANVGVKLDGVQVENERLLQRTEEQSCNLHECLLEREVELRTSHEELVGVLQARLTTLQSENTNQLNEVHQQLKRVEEEKLELQQQWERARVELDEARTELDQYRTRAQRILQDKEKLIAELRGQGSTERSTPVEDTVELELEQLRQERELLREEVSRLSARLQASRDELQEMERRLEAGREQASHTIQLLQDILQEERKKRQAAEDECRTNLEELRSIREASPRYHVDLIKNIQKKEGEVTRLRAQLAERPVSPPDTEELESRLHVLTQTLVQKQASLETVTTEKNALRLQLEKMESKHRESLALLRQLQTGVVNMNDTDDAKARVPSFLLESPFDTGMTLRVKRAYSSLDAIGIRTGVFLRRYPLARILVMLYVVLLHLWVMLVLFSSTPQPQM